MSQQLSEDKIATGISLGNQAPDFCLKNYNGDDIYLNKVLHVVLSFYRGDWCPVCQIESATR